MKNSGIEWIGEIPDGWEIRPLKYLFSFEKGLPITKADLLPSGIKVISYGQIHAKYNRSAYVDEQLYRYVSEKYLKANRNSLVQKGDFIFADTSEDIEGAGDFVYIDIKDIIFAGYHSIILRHRSKDTNKYLAYLFMTKEWKSQIQSRVSGIKVYSISRGILAKALLLLPPMQRQCQIVEYLDKKCAAVDRLIENQRAQIEKLKEYKQSVITEAVTRGLDPSAPMKDSGVGWIGDIPKGWEMLKMVQVCNLITDYVASGSFADLANNVTYLDYPDYALLVRTIDVSGKGHNAQCVYINKHAYDFLANSNLYGGELMFPNIGASVGDVYIVPKLYEKMSLAPNSIMVRAKYNNKFIYYYFSTTIGRFSLLDIAQSTAQPKFNKTDFRQLKIIFPEIEEQRQIVDYLDKKCAEIDKLIAIKQQKIETLTEYNKSLIYEYVTGKKQVG